MLFRRQTVKPLQSRKTQNCCPIMLTCFCSFTLNNGQHTPQGAYDECVRFTNTCSVVRPGTRSRSYASALVRSTDMSSGHRWFRTRGRGHSLCIWGAALCLENAPQESKNQYRLLLQLLVNTVVARLVTRRFLSSHGVRPERVPALPMVSLALYLHTCHWARYLAC